MKGMLAYTSITTTTYRGLYPHILVWFSKAAVHVNEIALLLVVTTSMQYKWF